MDRLSFVALNRQGNVGKIVIDTGTGLFDTGLEVGKDSALLPSTDKEMLARLSLTQALEVGNVWTDSALLPSTDKEMLARLSLTQALEVGNDSALLPSTDKEMLARLSLTQALEVGMTQLCCAQQTRKCWQDFANTGTGGWE